MPLSVQVSKLPLPGEQAPAQRLPGLAAVAADWATGQPLPLPLLCGLTPHGDATLSLLQRHAKQAPAGVQDAGESATAAAVPVLLPAARAGDGSGDEAEEEGEEATRAATAAGGALVPYVKGVPPALVAAVAAGELRCVLQVVTRITIETMELLSLLLTWRDVAALCTCVLQCAELVTGRKPLLMHMLMLRSPSPSTSDPHPITTLRFPSTSAQLPAGGAAAAGPACPI